MYECNICGYKTQRSYNFKLHNARKTKCKPCEIETVLEKITEKTETIGNIINQECAAVCKQINSIQCEVCFKLFNTISAKYKHKKKPVKCKPPTNAPESVQEELERLRKENEMLKANTNGSSMNNSHNNTTNNTTNIDKSTTINIQYNNYDKPNTDHITNKVMKGIFETSKRDPALILNETVRRIYKNDKHPENDVIKMGEKTALSRVYKDGKEIWLPMDGVIQTVMTSAGEFCADRLRDCHEEGVIEGSKVVVVWKIMEVLGTDDREDDCLNRSAYIQSIKSAFL
jgi:acetyl/propionyl-CoA carboxylase alpha subunit